MFYSIIHKNKLILVPTAHLAGPDGTQFGKHWCTWCMPTQEYCENLSLFYQTKQGISKISGLDFIIYFMYTIKQLHLQFYCKTYSNVQANQFIGPYIKRKKIQNYKTIHRYYEPLLLFIKTVFTFYFIQFFFLFVNINSLKSFVCLKKSRTIRKT